MTGQESLARAYTQVPLLSSCCFMTIHSTHSQGSSARSLPILRHIAADSTSSFAIIRSQHPSPTQNFNHASPQRSTKSSSCVRASSSARMRYTFSRKIRYFPDAGCIRSQLVFVYDTRSEQVRRAVDLFDQGKWEDLWRAKARATKNPRQSKVKSDAQKDKY